MKLLKAMLMAAGLIGAWFAASFVATLTARYASYKGVSDPVIGVAFVAVGFALFTYLFYTRKP